MSLESFEFLFWPHWGAIGHISTVIGIIVAVCGLIYQSRSTKKQLQLQNFIEYTKRYQEITLNFPVDINECNFSINNLKEIEKNKTLRYMRAYFDMCFEEQKLHDLKYINNDFWNIWEVGMREALSKPAFRDAWKIIKISSNNGSDFEDFIETLISPQ